MSLLKPPLYEAHDAAGADFTDFGGWSMPVTFDGIQQEHEAVRESAGVFDVSHMSEVAVSGPDASALMNRLTTNDIDDLDAGGAQYSCILDEEGVILDDTVIYRYPERNGYLFVPNAGHGEQMVSRWSEFAGEFGLDATIENRTDETGLVAVQGPDAVSITDCVTADSMDDVGRFTCTRTEITDVPCLITRTGYTGEDGFEIFFDSDESAAVWSAFKDVQPCGLGARDTLRLEAGLLLSGQDFDPEEEPRNPLEAGLEFVVDFGKSEFVGRDALVKQQRDGVDEEIIGLEIGGRGIARHGYPILSEDGEIGHVTSGTMIPTYSVPLALEYVDTDYAEAETEVEVRIRDRNVAATIVDQRFVNTLKTD